MTESAKSALLSYQQAMENSDLDGLTELFGDAALLELPFVKPRRLVGRAEIFVAYREIFENLDYVALDIASIAESGTVAIAHGELVYRRKGGEQHDCQLGVVSEMNGKELKRISMYCDTRYARLWCDKTIT